MHSTAQNDNLQIHEEKQRGVYIKNLSDFYVGSAAEVCEIMRQGGLARAVSSTSEYLLTLGTSVSLESQPLSRNEKT